MARPATKTVNEELLGSESIMGFLNHEANDIGADRWELYCKMLTCLYLVKFLEQSGYFLGIE
jgi:hypothetical protein